jgi:hypothetical protein
MLAISDQSRQCLQKEKVKEVDSRRLTNFVADRKRLE